MTGAFVSRRRADEFDAMVSTPALERDTASQDAGLVELVGSLRSMPEVSARPDFVTDLRSRLIVEAARQARPVVDADLRLRLTPRQRSGARERRAATILGGFAIVAATGSMAVASQSSLPGDVLYPVKRAIENAQTNLQSDDAAKAQSLIAHAERRLEEAEQLTAQGASATTVAATLQDFTEQSNQATELALDDYAATGDEEAIGELRSFADDSMDDLGNLGDVVPTDARPALITAAQSVLQLDSAAFQACPTCGDGAITELPDDLALQSASLDADDLSGLLSLQGTAQSILLPPGLLDRNKIEDLADQENKPDKQDDVKDEDPATPTDDPSDDPAPTSDSIKDLSDKIKDGLGGGDDNDTPSHPVDDAVATVGTVVDGVAGLVDGIVVGIVGAP